MGHKCFLLLAAAINGAVTVGSLMHKFTTRCQCHTASKPFFLPLQTPFIRGILTWWLLCNLIACRVKFIGLSYHNEHFQRISWYVDFWVRAIQICAHIYSRLFFRMHDTTNLQMLIIKVDLLISYSNKKIVFNEDKVRLGLIYWADLWK